MVHLFKVALKTEDNYKYVVAKNKNEIRDYFGKENIEEMTDLLYPTILTDVEKTKELYWYRS